MKTRVHNDHGVVLLELIVALTIFASISLGLVTALSTAIKDAQERNLVGVVQRGIENQLSQLHASLVVPGERDLEENAGGASYHLAVAPEALSDQHHQSLPSLYRATITASWKENGQVETRSISELIYQP